MRRPALVDHIAGARGLVLLDMPPIATGAGGHGDRNVMRSEPMAKTKAATSLPVAAQVVAAVKTQAADLLRPKAGEQNPITGSDNPAFSRHLLSTVGSTLWFPEGTPPEQIVAATAAALSAVQGFAPRDPVEGMMAAQAVALHHAAMECFRRAMIPGQSFEVADRLRRQGANLSRAMVDMAEGIDRRRGKGPQVVRVERVVVQDGGQAIVGTITPGGGSNAG
jgi:hypothetical protein